MYADYHIHTEFSDDSREPMEKQIEKAIELGLQEICFTDHVDYGIKKDWEEGNIEWREGDGVSYADAKDPLANVDYPAYFDKIGRMKEIYGDRIRIRQGLEFGVQTITIPQYEKLWNRYGGQLDFALLSIHQVDNKEFWTQDFQRGRTQKEYNEKYYEEILQVIRKFKHYSVLAHLDLIIRYDKNGVYPFGEVNTASWTSQNGSKLGTCKSSLGYVGTVFEPIDEYKGDFARAMMYMSVRYYTEDDNWGTSGMTNKSEILPWAIQMLLDWSDNDPVSQKEIDRNNVIYSDYQHNRNPFIDHPEYARMIWDPNWHGGMGGYEKVTSADAITDGDYLIVCENNNVAFNGGLTTLDAIGNKIDVTISGNIIESNAETDAAAFTITAKTGGYSIKSASGYYIGNTSDANALKTSTTDTYVNTISIAGGDADIVCSSSHLRFNPANNQTRFRYFKSSSYTSQQAIQLYKKIAVYSINLADVENGSISADTDIAVEGTIITLTATPDAGYELDYWTVTAADGSFVTVADNQFVMPASNVTVSAVFAVAFSQQYHLVTNANQLIAGRTYLIVNTQYAKALNTKHQQPLGGISGS